MKVKYVGADVHGQTTTFVVKDDRGRNLSISTVPTTGEALTEFVRSLSGEVHLALEQGTQARWIHGLLNRRVKELVVCDPRKNKKPGYQGNKSDNKDAEELAELLLRNDLVPVFQLDEAQRGLANLVRTRQVAVADCTRVKNRIRAMYRARAIQVAANRVYSQKLGRELAAQMSEPGVQQHLEMLYAQLDLLQRSKADATRRLLREARRHTAWRLLKTVPGIGSIGAAEIVGVVGTPYRFPTKQAFWAYCGLAVVRRTTGDFEVKADGQIVRKKGYAHTRGLNRNRNPHMKRVFKNASVSSRGHGEVAEYFQSLLAKGLKKQVAEVQVARKLATIALTIWKKQERYDKKYLTQNNEA